MGLRPLGTGVRRRLLALGGLAVIGCTVLAVSPAVTSASASASFNLPDVRTGLCLDSNYSNPQYPAVGAVYTDGCNGGNYQAWSFNNSGTGTVTQIKDAQTGLCLDSNYSNPQFPATGAVYTDPCNGGTYQQWRITDANPEGLIFQDVQTGLCLDSNYSNPQFPATGAVYTDGCNGGNFQEFGGM
jgi:serine/threonine-protein kinase